MRAIVPSLLLVMFGAACGGRYHTELVGRGDATVAARGDATAASPTAAPGGGGIALPPGAYRMKVWFQLPRAQRVAWKLVCPGVERDGEVGEPFEAYRERRIAELRREADRQRQYVASATGMVVNAVAPPVRAEAHVQTPQGEVAVAGEAHAGDAVAAQVAVEAVGVPMELPPGDLGQGTLTAQVELATTDAGLCALTAVADDATVRATFEVIRIRDLHREERDRRMAATTVAVETRGKLRTQLLGFGVDATARQRAHAAAVAERQRVIDAELAVKLRAQVVANAPRDRALHFRREYMAWLVGRCDADPQRREKLATAERQRREARLFADAELAMRREGDAMLARQRLRTYLVGLGAMPRPPRPELRPDEQPPRPADDAEWIAGEWIWEATAWVWYAGYWDWAGYVASDHGDSGGGSWDTGPRDHRRPRGRFRDHRNGRDDTPSPSAASVRDHRAGDRATWERDTRDTPPPRSEPARPARDREQTTTWSNGSSSGASVRDHRDRNDKPDRNDDKRDDDRPAVRDHRRR